MFRRPPRPPRTGPLLPYPTLFRSMADLRIVPGALTLADLRRLYRTRPALELDPASRAAIADSAATVARVIASGEVVRAEEHTYDLQSPMRISYAGFCLKKQP